MAACAEAASGPPTAEQASSVDPVLRRAVKAMQEDNIADVLKGAGIDAHLKKGSKKLTQAGRR